MAGWRRTVACWSALLGEQAAGERLGRGAGVSVAVADGELTPAVSVVSSLEQPRRARPLGRTVTDRPGRLPVGSAHGGRSRRRRQRRSPTRWRARPTAAEGGCIATGRALARCISASPRARADGPRTARRPVRPDRHPRSSDSHTSLRLPVPLAVVPARNGQAHARGAFGVVGSLSPRGGPASRVGCVLVVG